MSTSYLHIRLVGILALAFLFAGCASVPAHHFHDKKVSTAWSAPADTRLGKRYAAGQAQNPEHSGVVLLSRGENAFNARVALIDAAERTIDVQYYLWYGDTTGKLMLSRLLSAAQRGVRVRILIDDINLNGLDFSLALLDSHPNLEVRIFNPFGSRASPIGRLVEFLGGARHLNHRMHNKAFIVDNVSAIIGGRNIGDHYFGVNTDANFRDVDMMAVGRVVPEVSRSFDAYWNGTWAVPVKALVKDAPPEERVNRARDALQSFTDQLEGYPYPHRRDLQAALDSLDDLDKRLIWARTSVMYDDPEKVGNPDSQRMGQAIARIIQGAGSELMIESAYFVPLDAGVRSLAELTARGVRVRVLTNSLASTDVAAAHGGYAKYRPDMLRHGVELHEFRPDGKPDTRRRAGSGFYGSSRISLHSKAMVVDRRLVYIGTANLDPRSLVLNTEIGLLVDSAEFAATVARFIESGFDPASSWRVTKPLPTEREPLLEPVDLVWTSVRNGVLTRVTHDPDAGIARSLGAALLSLLPIDDQL